MGLGRTEERRRGAQRAAGAIDCVLKGEGEEAMPALLEALARGLPLLIVKPTPGQEERNSDQLLEAGAALRCNRLLTLAWKIERLLAEPGQLDRLQASARAAGRPRGCLDIVSAMRTLVSSTPPQGLPPLGEARQWGPDTPGRPGRRRQASRP